MYKFRCCIESLKIDHFKICMYYFKKLIENSEIILKTRYYNSPNKAPLIYKPVLQLKAREHTRLKTQIRESSSQGCAVAPSLARPVTSWMNGQGASLWEALRHPGRSQFCPKTSELSIGFGNQESITFYQLVFKNLFINCMENNSQQEVLVILTKSSLNEFPESSFVFYEARGLSGAQ